MMKTDESQLQDTTVPDSPTLELNRLQAELHSIAQQYEDMIVQIQQPQECHYQQYVQQLQKWEQQMQLHQQQLQKQKQEHQQTQQTIAQPFQRFLIQHSLSGTTPPLPVLQPPPLVQSVVLPPAQYIPLLAPHPNIVTGTRSENIFQSKSIHPRFLPHQTAPLSSQILLLVPSPVITSPSSFVLPPSSYAQQVSANSGIQSLDNVNRRPFPINAKELNSLVDTPE
eukprot:Ihof_evm4s294 gene=Ihof_evmTU4s294